MAHAHMHYGRYDPFGLALQQFQMSETTAKAVSATALFALEHG